jgi:DNA-binding MarR family transcriptional regulator
MPVAKKVSPAQVLDALAARPGATAAGLAEAVGAGQSTTAKYLAALEAEGAVRREPGGREAGRKLADRWTVAVTDDWPAAAAAEGASADSTGLAEAPEPPAEPPAVDAADAADAGPTHRLGRGALGTLVRKYLAARPDEDLGPTQIGKALGRSQGAVSNALGRLEASGQAQLVSTSPRRYRIVTGR